jgi:hypothetical protein
MVGALRQAVAGHLEPQMFNRIVQYLKQICQSLRTWGWVSKSLNGTQMIVKQATSAAPATDEQLHSTVTDEQLYTSVINNQNRRGQDSDLPFTQFKAFIHKMLKVALTKGHTQVRVGRLIQGAVDYGIFNEVQPPDQRYRRGYNYFTQQKRDLPDGWAVMAVNGKNTCVYTGKMIVKQATSAAPATNKQLHNVIDNQNKRGQDGESIMSLFSDKLKIILDRIDKDPKVQPKMIRAGAVSNARLKQMAQTLRTWGWELKSINGTHMIVKLPPSAAPATGEQQHTPIFVEPRKNYTGWTKTTCPACGGDGGPGGRCYKCDGSGWV